MAFALAFTASSMYTCKAVLGLRSCSFSVCERRTLMLALYHRTDSFHFPSPASVAVKFPAQPLPHPLQTCLHQRRSGFPFGQGRGGGPPEGDEGVAEYGGRVQRAAVEHGGGRDQRIRAGFGPALDAVAELVVDGAEEAWLETLCYVERDQMTPGVWG